MGAPVGASPYDPCGTGGQLAAAACLGGSAQTGTAREPQLAQARSPALSCLPQFLHHAAVGPPNPRSSQTAPPAVAAIRPRSVDGRRVQPTKGLRAFPSTKRGTWRDATMVLLDSP